MTDESEWDVGTWEGARRAAIRRALRLTVRERLEALDALNETAGHLARIGAAARAQGHGRAGPRASTRPERRTIGEG